MPCAGWTRSWPVKVQSKVQKPAEGHRLRVPLRFENRRPRWGSGPRLPHLYRLVAHSTSDQAGHARRQTAVSRFALPVAVRAQIQLQVAAGESLRSLAREYSVSHECIRRIAHAFPQ